MSTSFSTQVLIVTDHPEPSSALLELLRRRTHEGRCTFRLLVLNPARAEMSLLHPERHRQVEQAERALHKALPDFELAVGAPVLGSVSIRHDPYLAVEELMAAETFEEFVVDVARHGLSERLHLDLPHRLQHFGLPVTTCEPALA